MLTNLSAELITCIAEKCDFLRDVANTAVTCRRLYDILDSLLYRRSVELDPEWTLRWAAERGQISTMIKWFEYIKASGDQRVWAFDGALHAAAAAGKDNAVDLLLDRGADIECIDNKRQSPLMQAVRQGSESTTKALLDRGANPDSHDFTSEPVLLVAASQGHLPIASLLLNGKASLYATDNMGHNAVSVAAYHGHTAVVKLFADATIGWDSDKRLTVMENSMHQAILGSSKPTVEFLLHRGYCPPLNTEQGRLILEQGYASGNLEILDLLFSHDASAEARHEVYKTALFRSSCYSDSNLLRYLIERHASINSTDDQGQTVLMHLARSPSNNMTSLRFVIDEEADLDARDSSGWTALLYATSTGAQPAVELLLAAGADSTIPSMDGSTPLMQAAGQGYLGIVELLLQSHYSELDAIDSQGVSALYLAVKNARHNVVALLLQHGANANYRTREGRTLVSVAISIGNSFILRRLIAAGVDINSRDGTNGRTPVMLAVAKEDWNIFRWLIAHGSNLSLVDYSGRNAMACAPDAAAQSIVARLSHTLQNLHAVRQKKRRQEPKSVDASVSLGLASPEDSVAI